MNETAIQFANRRIREVATEFRITMTEVRSIWPVDSPRWAGERWCAVMLDALAERVIPAKVLDSLTVGQRYRISHDYARSIPTGYVNPEARR